MLPEKLKGSAVAVIDEAPSALAIEATKASDAAVIVAADNDGAGSGESGSTAAVITEAPSATVTEATNASVAAVIAVADSDLAGFGVKDPQLL